MRGFISRVPFTNEAGSTHDEVINSHNLHVRSDENPHPIVTTKHQNIYLVNIWLGIIGGYLLGWYETVRILKRMAGE